MINSWLQSLFLRTALLFVFLVSLAFFLDFVRGVDALKIALWGIVFNVFLLSLRSFVSVKLANMMWLFFAMLLIVDLASQGVLRGSFGASPTPSIIAQALANTNSSEVVDFIFTNQRILLKAFGFVVACTFAAIWFFRRCIRDGSIGNPRRLYLLVLGAITLALHLNPTMLKQQPLLRWPVLAYRHHEESQQIADAKRIREKIWQGKAQWGLSSTAPTSAPKTVVVIIGESANRHNWSWYGYLRPTTQALENALAKSLGYSVRFTQATSGAAYTLQSLRLALTPADNQHPEIWSSTPDFMLMAKAGGYQSTWLSNQVAYEGWLSVLGKGADAHAFVNNGNWRDTSSTDFDLLPHLDMVLAKPPANKELIVIHQLGQHFHYDLRCPADSMMRPFKNIKDDVVMRAMESAGRSSAIRQARNHYDDAIFCGAVFTASVLEKLQLQRGAREIELIYFSDHGQEVGHTQDLASHSESSIHGYSVPLFIWSNRELKLKGGQLSKALLKGGTTDYAAPYSLNDLDHLLQGALGVRTQWYRAERDPISREK